MIKTANKKQVPFNIKHDNRKKSREAWRAERATYIGASDVCALLGVSKYRGPYEVAAVKLGQVEEFNGNAVTRLGTLMERPILEYWLAENAEHAESPVDCVEVFTCPFVLSHPDHPMLACNLDAYGVNSDGDTFVIEIKHTGIYGRESLAAWQNGETPSGIALEYWTQVQSQLVVTGCAYAYLIAMCDKTLFVIRVAADDFAAELIKKEVPAFWEKHVETGVLPVPSSADGGALDKMYPPASSADGDDAVCVRVDLADRVEQIRKKVACLDAEIAKHKKHCDLLKNEIKAQMGSVETMYLDAEKSIRPVKWRTVTPKGDTARRPYRLFRL